LELCQCAHSQSDGMGMTPWYLTDKDEEPFSFWSGHNTPGAER